MGHVGKPNIYATWPFVKVCLILNYLGQGAWIIANAGNGDLAAVSDLNPFFQMLPEQVRVFAVLLSTFAAIIASQALITGSYSIVSEAVRLDLMPHMRINYPSETKGQIYIPLVNSIMWIGCICVVLLFQTSAHMEAAYGLAITVTMLMTTILLTMYLSKVQHKTALAVPFAIFFGAIEFMFFFSSLTKFFHGGYVTVIMSFLIFVVMYVWRRGTAVERTQTVFLPVREYLDQIFDLSTTTTTRCSRTTWSSSPMTRRSTSSTATSFTRFWTSAPSAPRRTTSSTSRSPTSRTPTSSSSTTLTPTSSSRCSCAWASR